MAETARKSSSQELALYPPVTGQTEERCREALRHIAQVQLSVVARLSCLGNMAGYGELCL